MSANKDYVIWDIKNVINLIFKYLPLPHYTKEMMQHYLPRQLWTYREMAKPLNQKKDDLSTLGIDSRIG